MPIAQGKVTLEITIEKNTIEDLLNVVKEINNYNLEIYEVDFLTNSSNKHKLKVDDINVEWKYIADD